MWPPLLVVGLTGGIASGKTTVSRMFADLGVVVLNADNEGRAVVEPGEPALAELIAAFGAEYLDAGGRLDRRALGGRVFSSPEELRTLNRITHPRIAERLARRLRALMSRPPDPPIVVLEAAVLVEAGWTELVDEVVVVVAQPSTQVARLMAGLKLTASEAEARIHAQIPLRKRLRHATFRIDGEAPLTETRNQVAAVWEHLTRRAQNEDHSGRSKPVPPPPQR